MHDVGAKVHTLKGLKLHAKMILADDQRAIVGSINLSPGSFDGRRELAIETDAHHVVKRLNKAAQTDWENSHKLDLTDEGLLKDLSKRATTQGGAELLVVKAGGKDAHKPKSKHDGTD
jgi:cardiolipin synthase A/B